MATKILLLYFILFLNLFGNYENKNITIINCEEVEIKDDQETCVKCKDKHFLFFNNLYCLPCDDENYGQIGCGGNCDSSRFQQDKIVYCNPNECKENYYNLNGICFNCSIGSPGCKTCNVSETLINGQKDYSYKCQECLSKEYKLNEFGTCQKCSMEHCKKCHYNNSLINECEECDNGYYLSSNKTCQKCHQYVEIGHGYCTICSDNINDYDYDSRIYCYCYSDSVLNLNKTCSYCGEGCNNCILKEDNTPFCISCSSGTFISENKCLICPKGCSTCEIDNNNNATKCTSCYSGYALSSNGTCKFCSNGCNNCIIKQNFETSCLSCYDNYYVYELNGTCTYCGNIDYIGGYGCYRCGYNNITEKYECYQCNYYYDGEKYIYNYAYIKNRFQCLSNINSTEKYLYGCLEANYTDNKYECLKCKEGFIPIINDKVCRTNDEIKLSSFCLEVINIGNITNPIYSCSKCHDESAKIIDYNYYNITNCFEREDRLAYCLEGIKDRDFNYTCIKCVQNANLTENNICNCNTDSFGIRNLSCYKCDDLERGNPGCLASEGCEYRIINDQLNCNKCKSDYFEYTKGQCFSCFNEIGFCNQCKIDSTNQLICDNCIENFSYNTEEKYCEMNCEEYPEISPGCIICNDNSYITQNKCQLCKPNYFKTKDEQCIYCRSEKYGGPACNKCKYENNTNGNDIESIKCANCSGDYQILNSKGKCYNCKINLFEECESCKFINNDNNEKLICTLCKPGYYLDSNGNCINYIKYIKKIPNCQRYIYKIHNISFYMYYYNDYYQEVNYRNVYYNNSYYYNYKDYKDFNNFINFINNNIKEINSTIYGYCDYCINGYYSNYDICIKEEIQSCTILSMIENWNTYYKCEEFCRNNYFPLIVLILNNTINNKSDLTISEIIEEYRNNNGLKNELKNVMNQTLCIDNSGKSVKNSNENLKNCIIALFIERENKYICYRCSNGYNLDEETNLCMKFEFNCEYEKNGNIYNCTKCLNNYNDYNYYDYYYNNYYNHYIYNVSYDEKYNSYSNYILVKEDNIAFCSEKSDIGLENCLEANADTTYIKTKYNCTSCSLNYLPYYSKFFERQICQNIFQDIIKNKTINLDQFKDIENVTANNGKCPRNALFTPDGKYCYECSNKKVGMPGCDGNCSFSLERNHIIKCEGKCKDGYIESSEGVCELCDNLNKGCYQCHYENGYPSDYFGIKRKRRFVCDNCEDDYIKKDEKCLHCSQIESHCEKCEMENNEFKCKKCGFGYILTGDNKCNYCGEKNKFIIGDNKCFECNDTKNGGIEGCTYCEINENKTICRLCEEGYILLSNNYTCLKISENNELNTFNKCEQLTLDNNNKLYCSRCKNYYFTLLKENGEEKCIYIPTLNSHYDYQYYHNSYYDKKTNNYDIDYVYDYYYFNYIYPYFEPCQEAVNSGTEDKPLFSCNKCYNLFEYDKIYENSYTLITEDKTNVSYCINSDYIYILENCTEAYMKIKGRKIKYSCAKCTKDNILVYNNEEDLNYCESMNTTSKCMVKYCKNCKSDNNYFCDSCLLSDYEVNSLTGSCVKKTEVEPDITWKDIFRLELNSVKEINGRNIYGPKLNLRGITNSQINTGHAFLIYLTFKIRQSIRLRNLEEKNVTIEAICEVIDGVEESKDETNIVDYECIGQNKENYELSELINIEDEDKSSNLGEVVSEKELSFLDDEPSYTLEDAIKSILFKMEVKNQTSNNSIFDFRIDGEINKDSEEEEIEGQLDMKENKTLKSDCIFTIEKNRKAFLNCILNVTQYKDQKTFTFKTLNISNENKIIELVDLHKVVLINEEGEEFNSTNFNNITDFNNITNFTNKIYNKENKKINAVIIVIPIVAALILVGTIILLIYLWLSRKTTDVTKNMIHLPQNSSTQVDKDLNQFNQTSDNTNN